MKKIRISEEAIHDLNQGFLFYEVQESGLGDYFLNCLSADIEGLRISAGVHRIVYRDYRRLLSRLFPHGIFYTYQDPEATVWAIIDLRRDTQWIRERLEK